MSTSYYGEQDFSQLTRNPSCDWLNQPLPEVDSVVIAKLRKINAGRYTYKVYMGCWCEDSQVLIPAFLALSKQLAIPQKRITYFALDPDKKSPKASEASDGVLFVPTFIVYDGKKEIGRIVETASPNFESALLALF